MVNSKQSQQSPKMESPNLPLVSAGYPNGESVGLDFPVNNFQKKFRNDQQFLHKKTQAAPNSTRNMSYPYNGVNHHIEQNYISSFPKPQQNVTNFVPNINGRSHFNQDRLSRPLPNPIPKNIQFNSKFNKFSRLVLPESITKKDELTDSKPSEPVVESIVDPEASKDFFAFITSKSNNPTEVKKIDSKVEDMKNKKQEESLVDKKIYSSNNGISSNDDKKSINEKPKITSINHSDKVSDKKSTNAAISTLTNTPEAGKHVTESNEEKLDMNKGFFDLITTVSLGSNKKSVSTEKISKIEQPTNKVNPKIKEPVNLNSQSSIDAKSTKLSSHATIKPIDTIVDEFLGKLNESEKKHDTTVSNQRTEMTSIKVTEKSVTPEPITVKKMDDFNSDFLNVITKIAEQNEKKTDKNIESKIEDDSKSSVKTPYTCKTRTTLVDTSADKQKVSTNSSSKKVAELHDSIVEKRKCLVGLRINGRNLFTVQDILSLKDHSTIDTKEGLKKLELRGCNIIKDSLRTKSKTSFKPSENLFKKPETIQEATGKFLTQTLNKVSLNNFHKLLQKIIDYQFSCAEEFEVLVDLFFEKCVNEHAWSYMYTQLFIKFYSKINQKLKTETNSGKLKALSGVVESLKEKIIEKCFTALVRSPEKEKEYTEARNVTGKTDIELDEIYRAAYELEVAYIKSYEGVLLTLSLFYAYNFVDYSTIKRVFGVFGSLSDAIDIGLACYFIEQVGDLVCKREKNNDLAEIISEINAKSKLGKITTKLKYQIVDLIDNHKKMWTGKKDRIIVPDHDMSMHEMDSVYQKQSSKKSSVTSVSSEIDNMNSRFRKSQTDNYKRSGLNPSSTYHPSYKKNFDLSHSNRQLDRDKLLEEPDKKSVKIFDASVNIDQNLDDIGGDIITPKMNKSNIHSRTLQKVKIFHKDDTEKSSVAKSEAFKGLSGKSEIKSGLRSETSFGSSPITKTPTKSVTKQSLDVPIDFDDTSDLTKQAQMMLNEYLFDFDLESFAIKLYNHELVDKIHYLVVSVLKLLEDQKISDHYSLGVLLVRVNKIQPSTEKFVRHCLKERMAYLCDLSFDLPLIWEFFTLMVFPLIESNIVSFDFVHELFNDCENFGLAVDELITTMFSTICTKFSVLEATKLILLSEKSKYWFDKLKSDFGSNQHIKSVISRIECSNLTLETYKPADFNLDQFINKFLDIDQDNQTVVESFNNLAEVVQSAAIYELTVRIYMHSMVNCDYKEILDKVFSLRDCEFLSFFFGGDSTPIHILHNVITLYQKFHKRHTMVFINVGTVLFKQKVVSVDEFNMLSQDSKLESLHPYIYQITKTKC